MKQAAEIYRRVADTCARIGRPESSVRILGACKKQSIEAVNAFIQFCNSRGHTALIGENYVQEWSEKREKLVGDYECHFIGHLQSNKAKDAAELFTTIETVDSLKLASKLAQAPRVMGLTLGVYIQVNISDDDAKSGTTPSQCAELVRNIVEFPQLKLKGLMTIPKLYEDHDAARLDYRALATLARSLEKELGRSLELSMGMSDDFEIAIEEGATIVRIGSALFGAR